jgi:hypothetical protein
MSEEKCFVGGRLCETEWNEPILECSYCKKPTCKMHRKDHECNPPPPPPYIHPTIKTFCCKELERLLVDYRWGCADIHEDLSIDIFAGYDGETEVTDLVVKYCMFCGARLSV